MMDNLIDRMIDDRMMKNAFPYHSVINHSVILGGVRVN